MFIMTLQRYYFQNNYLELSIFFALSLLSILCAIYLFRWCYKFTQYQRIINKIPGPPVKNVILGNFNILYPSIKSNNVKNTFQCAYNAWTGIAKLYQKAGIFRLWIGPFNPIIVFLKPNFCEALLSNSTNLTKAYEYKFLTPWLGYGLLISPVEKWKRNRKLLTPAFHVKVLEKFLSTFVKQQNILIQLIDDKISKCEGIVDDIRPLITNCTLDVICETAMGFTVNAQLNCNPDYVEAIRRAFALTIIRFVKPWLWTDFAFNFSKWGLIQQKWLKILHEFTDAVICERKQEMIQKLSSREQSNGKNHHSIDDATKTENNGRLAFLDILLKENLKNPQTLNELDVRSEVDTFMFGGHDTTASSLMYALLLIGHDPCVQNKIHSELDKIFDGNNSRDITMEDIRQMKYLEQCVRESLRLYPPIQIIGRQITHSFKVNGYEIPVGSTCYIPILSAHRDPEIYPNPEIFDPERFSPDNYCARHPYAFLPFSAGPRNCIGQKFAIIEEKAFLAAIFRKYRLTSLIHRHDIPIDMSIVLKPRTQLPFKFEYRF